MRSLRRYAQQEIYSNLHFQEPERLFTMKKNPRWRELCAQAAVEQDSDKLMALVAEITRLFEEEKVSRSTNPDSATKAGKGPDDSGEDPNT